MSRPPTTLVDLLRRAAADAPALGVVHLRNDGSEHTCTYADLLLDAGRVRAGLRELGLIPGTPAILLLDDSEQFLPAFWGCLAAGLVPVPLPAEPRRLLAVAALLETPLLVTDRGTAARVAGWMEGEAPDLPLAPVEELLDHEPDLELHAAAPSDLAYLQFSSGSTGSPRGVELTHANLLANIQQISEATAAREEDVMLTWMPYFHDMGLIGTHLLPLAAKMKQVRIDPLHFARRPGIWLETAHRHRATMLAAANFALTLVLRRVPAAKLAGLDLGSVRVLASGAEPVSPRICRAFLEHLAPCGLRPEALLPVYGLAEASLGVTFPPLGEGLRTRRVDREALAQRREVVLSGEGPGALDLADLGFPLPGCELRIVDAGRRPLGEGRIGEIEVRGPNVARGYHRAPEESRETFREGWLSTGDLGFLLEGRLCVTGRLKDVVFVNGRNHHATDLEEALQRIPGVVPGRVAVCGSHDPATGGERVVAFVATESAPLSEGAPVLREVQARLAALVDSNAVYVLPLPPRDFPRTTSGKLQRYRLRQRFESGALDALGRKVRDVLAPPAAPGESARTAPPDELERRIREIFGRVLGRAPAEIGVTDGLRALGVTSLQAMEVLAELETLLGRPLEPALLLECATLAELTDRLRTSAPAVVQVVPPAPARIPAREVAVIGMACRFPGADSPEAFWANLAAGVDSVGEIPPSRWPGEGCGAFLDDVAGFDAAFFGVEPQEAAVMDPQQRLLLEVGYEALERAGYAGPRREGKRVGVFVAVGEAGYQELILQRLAAGVPLPPATVVGNLRNLIAARIAHVLDLRGPVLAVDTACSSVLSALHLARQSLLRGECDLAVVGGVSLNLTATPYQLLSRAGALSPTGRCRVFSERADGLVPGEGAGALVLAPLEDAVRAGDPLLGVVRASAMNNDGRSLSPMAPNPLLQQAVLGEAYREARLDPATISYVEAHGTGTAIGDPIEVRSLAHALPLLPGDTSRALGSVKSNVGHLLNAAGMPALVKVLLSMQHRQLPPSLHADPPGTRFDLAAAGFEVVRSLRAWEGPLPLRAGINGFGFGGTNVHVVLEEPPGPRPGAAAPERRCPLLAISAKTPAALRATAGSLAAHLRAHPEQATAEVCAAASTARDPMPYRLALVAGGDLAEQLEAVAAGGGGAAERPAGRPRIAFLFVGQGALLPAQGRDLYEREPLFRQTLAEAAAHAGAVRGRTLLEWCLDPEAQARDLTRTAVAQPLLLALEVALARLVISWGITPEVVVGHSAGELAAACVAGQIRLEDAVRIAAERGRLMEDLATCGAMAAVFAPEERVEEVLASLPGEISIAAFNAPGQTVVSGHPAAVEEALRSLAGEGFHARPLRVSHAFHSPLMEPVREPFARLLSEVPLGPLSLAFLSTVDGAWREAGATLGADYWVEHLVQPVRFAPATERLAAEGFDTFVEVGPGTQLSGLVRATLGRERSGRAVLPLLGGRGGEERSLLEAMGRLWERGAPLDLLAIAVSPARRVPLPTYPFERTRHWVPDLPPGSGRDETSRLSGLPHPLLTRCERLRMDDAELAGEIAGSDPLVREHRVHGVQLLPGSGCWELVLAAAGQALSRPPGGLASATFLAPLRVPAGEVRTVSVRLRREDGRLRYELLSAGEPIGGGEVLPRAPESPGRVDLDEIRARCPESVAPSELYRDLAARGMVHGSYFRCLSRVWLGEGEALAELRLPEGADEGRAFVLHPALVDAAVQPVAALLMTRSPESEGLYLPFLVESLHLHAPPRSPCLTHVRLVSVADGEIVRCEVDLLDPAGARLLALRGLALKRISRSGFLSAGAETSAAGLLHHPVWVDAPLADASPSRTARRFRIIPDPRGRRDPLAAALAAALRAGGYDCELLAEGTEVPDSGELVFLAAPEPVDGPRDLAELDSRLETGAYRLWELGRELARRERGRRPSALRVVTSGVHRVAGEESGSPAGAALVGLARALPQEIPGLRVRAVDLDPREESEALVATLLRELEAEGTEGGDAAEGVVWRGGRRWARGLANGAPRAEGPPLTPPRADGVYLITGGATGIGAAIARWLAARVAPALVLVGRTALEAAPERVRLLEELRERGARAEYLRGDVADEHDVARILAYVHERYGPVSGVVHAAGVVAPGTLRSKERDDLDRVLAPKVRGSWLLARGLRGDPLDFFILCSSISSVLPGLGGGLGDYVAANAFLDAFAASERGVGRSFLSINWSVWGETGMGARPELLAALKSRGLSPLSSREGLRALEEAFAIAGPQVVVLGEAAAEPALTRPEIPRATLVAAQEMDPAAVERLLQSRVAEALRITPDQVPPEVPFVSLGLDSLAAVELARRLEADVGGPLPATLLFEYPSIRELAARLGGSHPLQSAQADFVQFQPRIHSPDGPPPGRTDGSPFDLSPVQRAFLVGQQLHPDVAAHAFLRQTLAGPLSLEHLRDALSLLEERHPMLRLRVEGRAGDSPLQRFTAPAGADAWCELREWNGDLHGLEEAAANHRFDLASASPFRVEVVRETRQRTHLLLTLHHLAGDAWSLNLLAEELWQTYTALAAGRRPELPPLTSTFRECVQAMTQRDGAALERDRRWWSEGVPDARTRSLPLPYDGAPAELPHGRLCTLQVATGQELTAALGRRAAAGGVSLFHLLLSAYFRCLSRWSGEPEVAVNIARAQRQLRVAGVERIVGSFADLLPLHCRLQEEEGTAALAVRLQRRWLEAEKHGSLSYPELLRSWRDSGAVGRHAPGLPSFSFARFPIRLAEGCPLSIAAVAGSTGSAGTRLGLAGWEVDGALQFSWNFPAYLFSRATIERFAHEHLEELEDLVRTESSPRRSAPGELQGLAHRIREQCMRTPRAVAVWTDSGELSYADLDRASDRVAARLLARGAGRNRPVGLLTLPGPETVVGLVGILKAGAAWLPLDAEHPVARLADQLGQATTRTLVCQAETLPLARRLAESAAAPLEVVLPEELPDAPPVSVPGVAPEDVAYVIFTSGSTGSPKGVPITHASLCNYLEWAIETFGYRQGDRLAQTASICFDASVRQLLAPLLVGATIIPVGRELARDPARLLTLLERAKPTVWSSVPSLWERLLQAIEARANGGPPPLPALRWIHLGGEALHAAPVRRWMALYGAQARITNLYGPTEATINATWHPVELPPEEGRIPIGRPVRGATIQVLDPEGAAVPPGGTGELYLGGIGLSPGYLGSPESTVRAFTLSPQGERLYRTGDRVLLRADGALEYLGRMDDQVKIRGFRVELGEIEAVLATHPAVRQVAVTCTNGAERAARLTAHLVVRSTPPTEVELRRYLRERLPHYMIPHGFRMLDHLPLTASGKVDRLHLAETAPAVLPRSRRRERGPGGEGPTEERLARIWSELLGVRNVGREDDFFDLGGDSLSALEVFARLEVEGRPLPRPTVIYHASTLRALAAVVDAAAAAVPAEAAPPARSAPGEPFPLSPAQRGFLLAEALTPGRQVNWCASLELEGHLEHDLFQQAVDLLVERHSMLRVVFAPQTNPPRQLELAAPGRIKVRHEDLELLPADERRQALETAWETERRHGFARGEWPLLRLRLCRESAARHTLLVTAPHLIGDGFSAHLFGRELLQAYDALRRGVLPAFPPLRADFRAYVELLERELAVIPPDSEAYWRRAFRDLPAERPHPPQDGDALPLTRTVELEAATVRRLREQRNGMPASLHLRVLTAFLRQLRRWTGTDDLLVGTALSGRDYPLPDITRLFGSFATALPLRVHLEPGDFAAHLRQVAHDFAEARRFALPPDRIARLLPGGGTPYRVVGSRFFFTFLDFAALGPLTSETLTVRWDLARSEVELPGGTELLCAARSSEGGLRLTLRAAAGSCTEQGLSALAERMRIELEELAELPEHLPVVRFSEHPLPAIPGGTLDAALVGYLPPARQLLELAGLPDHPSAREQLRLRIFPDGQPLWLETLETPLGRSGFVCLPRFADELTPQLSARLVEEAGVGVRLAHARGARAVSLAGMLPSLTGYGFSVAKELGGGAGPILTTGHAVTVVSVVRTVEAALQAAGLALEDLRVAFVGLGSIGRAALELLLRSAPHPIGLVLCDLPSRAGPLRELARHLRDAAGYAGRIEISEADPFPGEAVYRSRLIVGATSTPGVLDVTALQPGTVVVDDSFPHCVDPASAIARMRTRRDVLVVGGGLLHCGDTARTVHLPLASEELRARIAGSLPADAVASCQLESLLLAADPGLPVTRGLVELEGALRYREALERAGVRAGPLHLGTFRVEDVLLEGRSRRLPSLSQGGG